MILRLALILFCLSMALNIGFASVDPDWLMLPAALAGWYAADLASGAIHMYMDYRPCRPGIGLDRLYFYEGSRESPEYAAMFRGVMSRIGPIERLVFDFKNHHPRPDALGRRALGRQINSTILFGTLPASLALNLAWLALPLPGWVIAGGVVMLIGGTFAQYFHGSLHRDDNPRFVAGLRRLGVPFFASPERAFKALARVTRFASSRAGHGPADAPFDLPGLQLPRGTVPEHLSKQALAAAGIPVPLGELARDLAAAQAAAARLGFPVVLKAQSATLSHKSDAGGVVLNLADADALSAGWSRLHADLARNAPGLALDGVLVERMAARGTELIVGARNDPDWGPVVLVGLGGIWAEALRDVRLLPPDLSVEAIAAELGKLKGAALLRGVRGSPALDVMAAADIVRRIGALVHAMPEIAEIDVNPVVLYSDGQGALALDALIVTR